MNHTITINGAHCQACLQLIRMELEDANLDKHIESLELIQDNQARLEITQCSPEELEKIQSTINTLENYSVTV